GIADADLHIERAAVGWSPTATLAKALGPIGSLILEVDDDAEQFLGRLVAFQGRHAPHRSATGRDLDAVQIELADRGVADVLLDDLGNLAGVHLCDRVVAEHGGQRFGLLGSHDLCLSIAVQDARKPSLNFSLTRTAAARLLGRALPALSNSRTSAERVCVLARSAMIVVGSMPAPSSASRRKSSPPSPTLAHSSRRMLTVT